MLPIQSDKESKNSQIVLIIPQATYRHPVNLTVDTSENIAVTVVHVQGPGTVCSALERTPPGTEVSNAEKRTIAVPVTTRKC